MKISSGLKHFKLLAAVRPVTDVRMRAIAMLDGLPAFAGLEAMAQLAALHTRFRVKFERHAFLLKVIRGTMPEQKRLRGDFEMTAGMTSQSSEAFAYTVSAGGGGGVTLHAELLIATKAYDSAFQESTLKSYYGRMFEILIREKS